MPPVNEDTALQQQQQQQHQHEHLPGVPCGECGKGESSQPNTPQYEHDSLQVSSNQPSTPTTPYPYPRDETPLLRSQGHQRTSSRDTNNNNNNITNNKKQQQQQQQQQQRSSPIPPPSSSSSSTRPPMDQRPSIIPFPYSFSINSGTSPKNPSTIVNIEKQPSFPNDNNVTSNWSFLQGDGDFIHSNSTNTPYLESPYIKHNNSSYYNYNLNKSSSNKAEYTNEKLNTKLLTDNLDCHSTISPAWWSRLRNKIWPRSSSNNNNSESWYSNPRYLLFTPIAFPAFVLLFGLALGITLFYTLNNINQVAFRQQFMWECIERGNIVQQAFVDTNSVVQDVLAFMTISPVVNNATVYAYSQIAVDAANRVSSDDPNNPNSTYAEFIHAVIFVADVSSSGRAGFEEFYGAIKQFDPKYGNTSTMLRPNETEYFPVEYYYPPTTFIDNVLGFDMASDPISEAALQKAANTSRKTLTDALNLTYNVPISPKHINESELTKGVIIFFPWYGNTANISTSATGQLDNSNQAQPAVIQGYVGGVYRLNQLFNNTIGEKFQNLSIHIVARDNQSQALLFDNAFTDPSNPDMLLLDSLAPDFTYVYTFAVADRKWDFTCTPTKSLLPSLVIPCVMMVIIAIFFVLLTIITRKFMIQYLHQRIRAEGINAKLGETNLMLLASKQDASAILDAIADPLVALDRDGYLVGMNSVAVRTLGFKGNEIERGEKIHVSKILAPLDEGFEDIELPSPNIENSIDIGDGSLGKLPAVHHRVTPPTRPSSPGHSTSHRPDSGQFSTSSNQIVPADQIQPLNDTEDQPLPSPITNVYRSGIRTMIARKCDGHKFEAQANFSPPRDTSVKFTQVVLFRDVSAEKRAERELEEAKRKAEEEEKQKSELLFFLCHEIRNPLHAITGLSDSLDQTITDPTVREEVNLLVTSANFMRSIVQDILNWTEYSKPQTPTESTMQIAQDPLNITSVLNEVRRNCDRESKSRNVHIVLRQNPEAESLDAEELYGDSNRLQQVMMKLVERAVDITAPLHENTLDHDSGLVQIGAEIVDHHIVKGVKVRFFVEDEVDRANWTSKEFDELLLPFARMNGSSGRHFTSIGLGMALANKIVNTMGGDIRVRSLANSPSSDFLRPTPERAPGCVAEFEIWLSTKETIERKRKLLAPMARTPSRSEVSTRGGRASPQRVDYFTRSSNYDTNGNIVVERSHSEPALATPNTEGVESISRSATLGPDSNSYFGDMSPSRKRTGSVKSDCPPARRDSFFLPSSSFTLPKLTLPDRSQKGSNSTSSTTNSVAPGSPKIGGTNSKTSSPSLTGDKTFTSPPPLTLSVPDDSEVAAIEKSASPSILVPIVEIVQAPSPDLPHPTPVQGRPRSTSKASSLTQTPVPPPPPLLTTPVHILLVEDNEILQKMTVKLLTGFGFIVSTANNGKEGAEKVLASLSLPPVEPSSDPSTSTATPIDRTRLPYKLVLMDIQTPIMNGYDATKYIRDHGCRIPILALTANALEPEKQRAKAVGMDGFLIKPLQGRKLAEVILSEIDRFEKGKPSGFIVVSN